MAAAVVHRACRFQEHMVVSVTAPNSRWHIHQLTLTSLSYKYGCNLALESRIYSLLELNLSTLKQTDLDIFVA